MLHSVNSSDKGYLEVVYGEIDDETLSRFDKYVIHQKCAIMSLSLQLALENMNKWTWKQCCKSAAVVADRMGLSLTKCPDTTEAVWTYLYFSKHCLSVVEGVGL
jgi:hypothetical protein